MLTPEVIEAELAYREELRRIRDAQGALGRPVPLVPWWRRSRTGERAKSRKARKARTGKTDRKLS
ncbi:hypothetical protein [Sciscionella marina]|uniref:hypothetical protein n=1 Tax=Sciscionella marina TaxID=508770 RepID=UPI000379BB5D|nr:hypothetical protein [Sciscionella marina]